MIRISITIAIFVVSLGGWFSVDFVLLPAASPLKNLKTIQEFKVWKGRALLGEGTYTHSGTTYTVLLGPAGRTLASGLASGPSAYLFDPSGQFVDWASGMGDLYTANNRFDLTSGHVKNAKRERRWGHRLVASEAT